MKKNFLLACLMLVSCLCWPFSSTAQHVAAVVDRVKYPDYSDQTNPDYSLMQPQPASKSAARGRAAISRPDHVNNAETQYFPPVFNQDGGSCGSASRICYMFSYELAAYRGVDASKAENYYPSHFVWLHTNSPGTQGKEHFGMHVGVPSAATYGGQTYSSQFGFQEEKDEDFGWMQGYDKWYEAMHNRITENRNFPLSVATEEGREAVKNWLWNHNGDESFKAGGICGVGVASGGQWKPIASTEANDAIGVTGMFYVQEWGTTVDHALTIVGYDDRIEFDIDKDGVYGEVDADEKGAWIIVNSWGDSWCNNGFIYCPYAFGGAYFNNDAEAGNRTFNENSFWAPEIYRVRKDYRPLRTIKLKMDYSRRSEIALSAGVSTDINATEPDMVTPFVHFTYSGDGNYGNTNPAPEIPMLGRWADGKLHAEPMEFGYDLTDLTGELDYSRPLKYFFTVDTKEWAQGNGTIHSASIIDYKYDEAGVEIPFAIGDGVEIRNAGEKTIISVVVYGNDYNVPQNVACAESLLQWQAPLPSGKSVVSYNVYCNGVLAANVPCNIYSYDLSAYGVFGECGVSAVYSDGKESSPVIAKLPVVASTPNANVMLSQSGFSIPDIFGKKYQQATIEFWIKPATLVDWNQSGGPGWGTFMFHANRDGRFTAGWDLENRINSSRSLSIGQWNHVAIVVDNNNMLLYLNGQLNNSVNSSSYSGLGGFGDLVFSASSVGNAQNAGYDEIRIWKSARTASQISEYKDKEFVGMVLPDELLAYFKGELIADDNGCYMRDCVGGHHARLLNDNYAQQSSGPQLGLMDGDVEVTIDAVAGIYAGIPVSFTATYNDVVSKLQWTVEGTDIRDLVIDSPTAIFAMPGEYVVKVKAFTAAGRTVETVTVVTVLDAPAIDVAFTATSANIPVGERVTFNVANPVMGYVYEWNMRGADVENATSANASTVYQRPGDYAVTLTVTAVDGRQASQTKTVTVVESAPEAAFSVTPAFVLKGENVILDDESRYTPTYYKWTLSSGVANYVVEARDAVVAIDKPGVYDVTLKVSNAAGSDCMTRERTLVVCNADSRNGLAFGNGDAMLAMENNPLLTSRGNFTIEWWMNAGRSSGYYCNAIGDTESTLLLKTDWSGCMVLFVGGESVMTSGDFVLPGEWHHYAVAFSAGTVEFYRDGVLVTVKNLNATVVPSFSEFRIGGEYAPFSGSVDEFRVWGKRLAIDDLRMYANAPVENVSQAETEHGLLLYYDFNQSGGDVVDATSNGNDAVRSGFGPDGDAWGLSRGVFCLNFEDTATDVTDLYLNNYTKPFGYAANQCVNSNLQGRTFALTGWKIENAVTDGGIITGAHVDRGKDYCMTATVGWDGFAGLNDHKVFQTLTLPEGYYTLTAEFDEYYEGQCDSSYVVAALGNTLPLTESIDNSLGYVAMQPKGPVAGNTVSFMIDEESEVSLGLLVNMTGRNCMTLQRFILKRSEVEYLEVSNAAIDKSALKALVDDTRALIEEHSDYCTVEAPLTADSEGEGYYIWCNASQNGSDVSSLLDGDKETYFHTNWQSSSAPSDGLDHHLTIELGEDAVSQFKFRYSARKGYALGDYPKTILVQGSNNGVDYTTITVVNPQLNGEIPANGAGWTSDVIKANRTFSYLRFMVTETTSNRNADGHIYWHMSEFALMPRSETVHVDSDNPNVIAAFEEANRVVVAAETVLEEAQSVEELEAVYAALQEAYDNLVVALTSARYPVMLTIDTKNPVVYKIGIKRGETKVLEYDMSGTQMVSVEDYNEGDVLQGWYFTKGTAGEQVFIHPYVGMGDVLASNDVTDGPEKVKAMPKDSEGYMQEWILATVSDGVYNIKPAEGSTYFSHHSGGAKKMGFYSSSTDIGSLFTFERVEFVDGVWKILLGDYLATQCLADVASGSGVGCFVNGDAYNAARAAAVELLADTTATAEEYENCYNALRAAREALEIIYPEEGKHYTLYNPELATYVYAGRDNRIYHTPDMSGNSAAVWQFERNEDGTFKLFNMHNGQYVKELGWNVASYLGDEGECTFSIEPQYYENYVFVKGDGNEMYAKDNGELVRYNTNAVGLSSWVIKEIEGDIAHTLAVGNAGWATLVLGFNAVIPVADDFKAYTVERVDEFVHLSEAKGVLDANTPVVINAAEGEYAFTYTTAEATVTSADILRGTLYDSYIAGEAYVLSLVSTGVCFCKVILNKDAEGADGTTHFLNNANKAYLVLPEASGISYYGIRFGNEDDETGIENVPERSAVGKVYDLTGRRVNDATLKGVYIIDGKKVVK